jgi:hypothetical protein
VSTPFKLPSLSSVYSGVLLLYCALEFESLQRACL